MAGYYFDTHAPVAQALDCERGADAFFAFLRRISRKRVRKHVEASIDGTFESRGNKGKFRARFGLWLDRDPECGFGFANEDVMRCIWSSIPDLIQHPQQPDDGDGDDHAPSRGDRRTLAIAELEMMKLEIGFIISDLEREIEAKPLKGAA